MKTLITLLLVSFFILLPLSGADAEEVYSQGDNRFATRELQLKINAARGERVSINSASHLGGKLFIIADSTAEAVFYYKKLLKTTGESEAIDYTNLIDIVMERTPVGIRLTFQAPNPPPWAGSDNSARIEGELHLPLDSRLEIDAGYFDLIIDGPFKAAVNKPSFGRVEVQEITENLDLSTTNQDISARDIGGRILLVTGNADIRIDNITALVKAAEIKSQNGSIMVNGIKGSVDIKNSYGKIKLDNAALSGPGSRIEGSYGPINIDLTEMKKTSLTLINDNDDIELRLPESVSAAFQVAVDREGEIDAEGLNMHPTAVDNTRLEFSTGNSLSTITVTAKGKGNVYLRGIAGVKR